RAQQTARLRFDPHSARVAAHFCCTAVDSCPAQLENLTIHRSPYLHIQRHRTLLHRISPPQNKSVGFPRPLAHSKIHLAGPLCWAQLAPDSLAIERALISPYPLTIALSRDAIQLPSCSTGYAR
ncbi:uncharacterized protein CCOS01_08568, partial [Colletotrichum costaricense]